MAPLKRSAPEDTPNLVTERPLLKRSRFEGERGSESNRERHRRHYSDLCVVLEKTIQGRYRDGSSNYNNVGVLLVCWQDEDVSSLGTEIRRLESVFRDQFHFQVEIFRIPSEKTVTSLNYKVSEFAHRYDSPSDLAILYYGGHGAGEDNKLRLYAREKPNRDGNPSAFFDDVVYALHHCDTDVLIITDCCYAALAFTEKEVGKRKFELLTATGPENETYATQSPRSFTRHLCETLEELVDSEEGFTTSKLYRKLYFKADPEFKPFLFDQSVQDWGRISLRPLKNPATSDEVVEAGGIAKGGTVLSMQLRLRRKPKPHDMNELARAMQYLPFVKQIQFKRMYAPKVELQGFIRGIRQAMTIRPFMTRLRESIQAKRKAEGRGATPQTSEMESNGVPVRSPQSPAQLYNWDNARIEKHSEDLAAVSTTPRPPTSSSSGVDLIMNDASEDDFSDANGVAIINGDT